MKSWIWILAVACGIVLPVTLQAQSRSLKLAEPGKVYTLQVTMNSGELNIMAYDGKDIVVEAKYKNGGNPLDLHPEIKGNNVIVNGEQPETAIVLTIKVPRQSGKIRTSIQKAGMQVITGVQGEVEVENKAGNITATDIAGTLLANTDRGNIVARFTSIKPATPLVFSTVAGSIEISLPPDVRAYVKMKTDQGAVASDFALTDIQRETGKDNHVHLLNGKISGGGPDIIMSTLTGNIHLMKSR